jgi:hypothetical protein
MVTAGVLPFRENFHGRAGNRTRDLMISSQKLWSLDHEAGLIWWYNTKNVLWCTVTYEFAILLLRALRFPEIRTCETTDKKHLLHTTDITPGKLTHSETLLTFNVPGSNLGQDAGYPLTVFLSRLANAVIVLYHTSLFIYLLTCSME